MSEPKRDDEPTMEEILASIRKIISEDDPGTAPAAAADGTAGADDDLEGSEPRGLDGGDPEPMELTQMVSEDGSVVDLRAEAERRWGDSFDLKTYHDKALSFGSIPTQFVRSLLFDLEM